MAKVFIFHNSLNSFAEGVFKPVLEQMVAANVGSFVEISSSKLIIKIYSSVT